MLEKIVSVDRIEVVESGAVHVRTKTAIVENGVQISLAFHRHVVAPGEDFGKEGGRVQAICAAVHTPEVVGAYQSNATPAWD